MSADAGWRRYRRRGEVTADQRGQAWTWTTTAGEAMRAEAGDWEVTDDKGNTRSVAAGVFESTHEQVGPHRYRRSGTVLARRAVRREVIPTLEGEVVANSGDWIVQGQHDERWPVRAEQFHDSYEGPLDTDAVDSGMGDDPT